MRLAMMALLICCTALPVAAQSQIDAGRSGAQPRIGDRNREAHELGRADAELDNRGRPGNPSRSNDRRKGRAWRKYEDRNGLYDRRRDESTGVGKPGQPAS